MTVAGSCDMQQWPASALLCPIKGLDKASYILQSPLTMLLVIVMTFVLVGQTALLVGVGLQRMELKELSGHLALPYPQLLALFNKVRLLFDFICWRHIPGRRSEHNQRYDCRYIWDIPSSTITWNREAPVQSTEGPAPAIGCTLIPSRTACTISHPFVTNIGACR